MNTHWRPGSETGRAAPGGSPAVVLVTDKNYFLPTFSTALSADAHISPEGATVHLFVVDAEEAWIRQFDSAIDGTAIRISPAHIPQLDELSAFHRDRHLPPITLARFWIGFLLDPGVDRFLYLDGDMMVDGELDTLLASAPPELGLMAAADFVGVFVDEIGYGKQRDVRYLRDIECTPEFYFNAGVVYASRRAWDAIVPEAIQFLRDRPDLCVKSDQTALNHAARGNVTLLPLRYNYQSDHMMVLDPRDVGEPATIWHFTGGPKPWNDSGWPWSEHFNTYYRKAQGLLAGCDVTTPVPPEKQTRAGLAHRHRARRRLDWVYPWRKLNRRRKIRPMLAGR